MPGPEHIVVDGSNIATEGRHTPSLAQLEEALSELRKEHPDAVITVVVDATFAHRIDPEELPRFEAAYERGEYVSPPAGAVGRGDAFLLRIAERVDAIVFSNDSFQEFHGEHPWLFERGRLLGGTPVPGVGWIFVQRTPVRGPRSRVAVKVSARAKQQVERAIAVATEEVVSEPSAPSNGGERASAPRSRAPRALNDPASFIAFIAEHRLGTTLDGDVDSFTSHGAVVRIGGVLGYVPLAGLGNPPPNSAREVLRKGERRAFALTALDPHRRGIELALPHVAVVSGHPSEETVAAEVRMARAGEPRKRRGDATPAASGKSSRTDNRPRRGRQRADSTADRAEGTPDGATSSAPGRPSPPKASPEKSEAGAAESRTATRGVLGRARRRRSPEPAALDAPAQQDGGPRRRLRKKTSDD